MIKNKSWAELIGNGIYRVKLNLLLDKQITITHDCKLEKLVSPTLELIFIDFLEIKCTNCKETMVLTAETYANWVKVVEDHEASQREFRKNLLAEFDKDAKSKQKQ